MSSLVAHGQGSLAPHDLWSAWNPDPVLLAGLFLAGWAYRRGRNGIRRTGRSSLWQEGCFAAALLAIGIALVSPLEALSEVLASAHMVQHVLLLLVAAPLLVLGAPAGRLLRGSPPVVRRVTARSRKALGLTRSNLRLFHHPGSIWLAHVGALWFWHAAIPYGMALDNHAVHILEHATFFITAVLFWRLVIGRPAARRVSPGFGILLLFATAMQSVFLSALLTFARTPWYSSYLQTTGSWGLTPLADQQLAGVIMWIPGGMLYVGVALALLVAWIGATESEDRSLRLSPGPSLPGPKP